MRISRQAVAEKITDYLHGKLSQAELVDWAERAIWTPTSTKLTLNSSRTLSADSVIAPK
jgi:hypothetical protein